VHGAVCCRKTGGLGAVGKRWMFGGKMLVQGPACLALYWKNIFIIRIMNLDPALEAKG
jgi:TfoX/Sxy family transcriptional regulator of competence genes